MAAPIGNWQTELENCAKNLCSVNITDELVHLKSDEEKIHFIRRKYLTSGIPWIKAYFENCQSLHTKSLVIASKARRNGNTLFQKKNYSGAAELYTKAILNSPYDSQELPLAYGNRSAVLFHLSQFKECLIDIEEAFKQGFPRPLQYKLYIRKLHCLTKLSCCKDRITVIRDAQEAVEDADANQKRKDQLQKEIKELEAKGTDSSRPSEIVPDASPVPEVSYGNSNILVQASNATSLQYNNTQGRYLTANVDIKTGDMLIVERPFAAVLLPEHYPTQCHHCFVKLTYSYPCRRCTQVIYCSPACAMDSWSSYHSIECPYLQLLHSVGIAHLSLRVILVAGLSYLKEFKRQLAKSKEGKTIPGLDSNGQYCRSYRTVYDLMTHVEDIDKQDLFQYTMTADLLLSILQHSGWFKTFSSMNSASFKPKQGRNKETIQGENESYQINKLKLAVDDIDLKHVNNYTNKSDDTNNTESSSDIKTLSEVNSDKNCISDKIDGENIEDINSIPRGKMTITDIKNAATNSTEDNNSSSLDNDPVNVKSKVTVIYQADAGDTHAADSDEELYIGGLLLRHILQLVCNAHAITELQCSEVLDRSKVEELSEVRVATAIYPTASLMNHSCDPTIIASFYKDVLVVRAVRDVSQGEEIFNSYGIHHKRMCFRERQRCLKQQYFFTCQCPPCVEGEKADNLLFSYRCSSCSGPLVQSKADLYTCGECQNQTAKVDTDTAEQASSLFQQGVELLQQNKVKDALQVMKRCCKLRTKILYKHNKDLSETQDCVARCLASLGLFSEAAVFLKDSISTVKVIYGENTVELANELQKLSEILISAQSWKEALTVTQEAIKVFVVHYGRENNTVKELTSASKQLKEIIAGQG